MPEYGFTVSVQNLASIKMKEIEESLAKMGVKAKVETKEVAKDFEFMGERMGETFKNLKSLLLTGLGITALFEGWEFIEHSKEAFEGLEKQVARLDTVLKSTNFKAGFSSEDIQNQAKEVSKGIVNSRQEILQAQGTLLSFTNIRGDIFKKALGSVADYSTFFGTDLASGARILGRALQDPLQGMNQLRRAGIVLTAQQKEQIKNYEQSGHLIKAQAVLLDELNKKFGGQAQAYAFTDAGKIQVARKQWEELEFKLGEIISRVEVSLIPSFSKIVDTIKSAFNSDLIQFFINHIKDLVSIALKLLPIWITYRAIMATISTITSIVAVKNGILSITMGELTFMTDGATTAFEGFGAALASFGVGALVIGLGLIIENLISMNKELDETVDKITNISKTEEVANANAEGYRGLSNRFITRKSVGKEGESSLLSDLINKQKEIEKGINETLNPSLVSTKRNLDQESAIKFLTQKKGETGVELSSRYEEHGKLVDKLSETYKEQLTQVDFAQHQFKNLGSYIKTLKEEGVKTLKYTNPGAGTRADAINTSNLSGASGGLGQARIIHVDFHGPFQQNIGVKESKAESEKAIEKLTEMINGFSQSVNSQ